MRKFRLVTLSAVAAFAYSTSPDANAQGMTGYAAIDSSAVARTAYRAGSAAMRTNDIATARREIERAASAWPTQEVYLWARVVLAVSAKDTTGITSALTSYARTGFGRPVSTDERFAPFLAVASVKNAAASVEANRAPLARSRVWTAFGDSSFWAEGMDVDVATGHAYVANIRGRSIAEVDRDGRTLRTLPAAGTPRIGAIFGVRVDARRGVLWATTSAVAHMANYLPADSTIASLLRIRLSDGAVERRWNLAPSAAGHTLGDVVVAANGDVFMTDSNDPVLYRLRSTGDTLERITHPLFRSLQGMAPTPDGRTIFLADWSYGLLRLDLATGSVIRLTDAPNSTSLGCDGIALFNGAIIAVQNGAIPNRVMRFVLDQAGTGIARAEVLDRNTDVADGPTIGAVVGTDFVYVANSQWDKHDDNGGRIPGTTVSRPMLLAVPLVAASGSPRRVGTERRVITPP